MSVYCRMYVMTPATKDTFMLVKNVESLSFSHLEAIYNDSERTKICIINIK